MSTSAHTRWHIVSRVAAGTVGAYGLTWGFAAFATTLLLAAGMAYGEASSLAAMLGFVLLLVAFCWAFAAASLRRVWLVLAGGGAAMTLAAWLLARHFVS